MGILNKWNITRKLLFVPALILAFTSPVFSQPPPKSSLANNPMAWMLLLVMTVLLLVIIILGNIVLRAKSIYRERIKEEKNKSTVAAPAVLLLVLFLSAIPGMAQNIPATAAKTTKLIGGLDPVTFYFMIGIIILEAIVIMALIYVLLLLVGIKAKPRTVRVPVVSKKFNWWWTKFNAAVSLDREKDIDLNHDYDGIRELDNKIPPWWNWTFAFTIVFGIGYLWRYHIAGTAPLQKEEFAIAMQRGEERKQEYLKNAANNVDENTIGMLDASGIAAGKSLYAANCVACHGANGEGAQVGPNLTDEYWIHSGSIAEIFKSIKYGWVDKGMKSWKDDFSPVQMAQLTSFVKSLKGSKPPNAKEPQGDLYKEPVPGASADTAKATGGTTSVASKPIDTVKQNTPSPAKNNK
jgi:cytochrome c oxidase cbb3-type subunit III